MFIVKKRMEIAGSHRLSLDYPSACTGIHGHNWIVTVHCAAPSLNKSGMVVDFKHIKNEIHDRLDHMHINDVLFEESVDESGNAVEGAINPTAENIAKWICEKVTGCYKVEVQESEGNTAIYINEPYLATLHSDHDEDCIYLKGAL